MRISWPRGGVLYAEGCALSEAVRTAGTLVALSTSSVYPDSTADAFEVAARLGYDGLEVMVYTDPVSQDLDVLRRLVDYHQVPVLAVHAPSVTQRVWGREPWGKLLRAQELAEQLGARVVVVHPPFRWQREYVRGFEAGLAKMAEETEVVFAVENMFPLRARGTEVVPYAPHWDPTALDVPNVTLDLSHTAASGSDAITMANELGDRLAHVHLADGTGETGVVVLEVNTRRAVTREDRVADLAESLAFARQHLASPATRPV